MDWTAHRIVALFLGLLIAAAPAIIAQPTVAMTVQMSLSDQAAPSSCDDCPNNGNDCTPMCANVVSVGVTPEGDSLILAVTNDAVPGASRLLNGQSPAPDPGPPRPGVLR